MPAALSPQPVDSNGISTSLHNYADDYIYPAHLLDGAKYQHCILTLLVRFNDILDPQKIKESLSRLLEIGDWKKLGGRFRTKVRDPPGMYNESCGTNCLEQGKGLEIHVPKHFSATRPAFRFAHEVCDCSIVEHPLGRQLPDPAGDGVSLSAPLDDLRRCGHGPDFPTTMADMIDQDAPQLCFKVLSFTDATVFATTFSHCTWDISGVQGFMKSLQLVLDGREDEVPPMLGASTDILADIASQYEGRHPEDGLLLNMSCKKKEREQSPLQDAPLEERIIRVPLDIVERLRSRVADEDLMEGEDNLMTYQSDELFMALIVKQIAKAQLTPRPLKLLNIINARLVVPRIANAKGIYAQNLVLLAPQILSHETTTGPMGQIVHFQRHCLAQSAVPENIVRSLHTVLRAIEADVDITALTDNGEAEPLLINNLVRLSTYIDVDLSSAVIRQGEDSATRRNGLGTPDFCYLTLPDNSYGMMRVTTLGSYNGNGYWMFGELPFRAWELIYEALEELEL